MKKGLVIFSLFFLPLFWAKASRMQDFLEHHQRQEKIDSIREKGLSEYLDEVNDWELQRLKALKNYKPITTGDDFETTRKSYLEFKAQKREEQMEMEEARRKYVKTQRAQTSLEISDLDEMVELGLLEDRPRYNYKKRVLYGAKSKYKMGSGAGSTATNTLPDHNTEQFNNFVPPPAPPEMDFPEPPPPPSFEDGDFPAPPPPPPPPSFDDADGF